MKSARKLAAVLAWTVIIAGCKHKRAPVIPAAATAPPPPTSTIEQASAPLPDVPPPGTPAVVPPNEQEEKPVQKPKHPAHRRKSATDAPGKDQAAKDSTPQQAAEAETAPASPIGQITTSGDSVTMPSEQQIRDTIGTTEKGLDNLKRAFTPSEKETIVQIRAFLKKARMALQQNDLEGAQTLATKAKVLLSELTRG